MILLRKLTLNNFLSHEHTEILFSDNQKLLIDGNSGSGKSAILEAIIWVLYGQGRTTNTSLIRRGTDKAQVSLCVSSGQDDIEIIRVVTKGKHTLQVVINGVAHPITGVRDLQNWIETELTGASYLLFVNSIAYVQGGPDSFVSQNATKRKDLLLEIVKTIDFDAFYEKTKEKISQEEKEVAGHEQSIGVRQEWLSHAEETVLQKDGVLSDIARLEIDEALTAKSREASVIALGTVDEQLKTITRVEAEKAVVQSSVATAHRTIEALTAEKNVLSSSVLTPLRDKAIVENELVGAHEQEKAAQRKVSEATASNAKKFALLQSQPRDLGWKGRADEVNKLLSDPANHNKCSAADCPYFHEKTSKIAEYASLYAEYIQKQGQYEAELQLWQNSFDAIPVIDATSLEAERSAAHERCLNIEKELGVIQKREADISRIAQITEKISELDVQLVEQTAREESLVNEIASLKLLLNETEITKHKQNIQSLDATLFTLRQDIRLKQQELGSILATEARIPETRQALEDSLALITATKQNIYRLTLLKDAFGSRGLKAIVIDYIIPELEEKINTILAQMSEFRVVLDTQMEKADGEGNKEGLFITIINDMGEEMPFESYSGGERLKIIVSITEALATLQKCGFRMYDETWVGLDENSLESFARVLDNLIERFPQVICVSHLQEIKTAFENKLTVIKHNGISHVS